MAEAAFGYGDPMSTITESRERSALDAVPKRLLIAGEWREASGGATLEVEDPSTGAALCSVADARLSRIPA